MYFVSLQVLIRGLKDVSKEELAVLPNLEAFIFPPAGPSTNQQQCVLAECTWREQKHALKTEEVKQQLCIETVRPSNRVETGYVSSRYLGFGIC